MVALNELMSPQLLHRMVNEGFIRVQHNLESGHQIYNYTHQAMFKRVWNEATVQCRGLVVDSMGKVLARPFPKFFNAGEHDSEFFRPDRPYLVQEKVDGSLIICTQDVLASRGSFTSDHVKWAESLLRGSYSDFQPAEGVTYLFELIHPENRIVLDYGEKEELRLLAVIDNETGTDMYLEEQLGCPEWNGPVVQHYDPQGCHVLDLAKKFSHLEGDAEGFVVIYPNRHGPSIRVKLKFDDYVRLHAILTNTNSRSVWECLSHGHTLRLLTEATPDEFHQWVNDVGDEIVANRQALDTATRKECGRIHQRVKYSSNYNKDFAEMAKEWKHPHLLFLLRDEKLKRYEDALWDAVKPELSHPFTATTS